jgi:ribosome maturation factor RimP
MGAQRPFFMNPVPDLSSGSGAGIQEDEVTDVRTKERELEREIVRQVEDALPGVEVLAVEFSGPERFTVYVDRPGGRVDHALCEKVTRVLWDYLRAYSVDVSSPGLERPLRKRRHFESVLGRRVKLRTADKSRVRGEVKSADETSVTVGVDGRDVAVPYDEIVRGNLIDEGR